MVRFASSAAAVVEDRGNLTSTGECGGAEAWPLVPGRGAPAGSPESTVGRVAEVRPSYGGARPRSAGGKGSEGADDASGRQSSNVPDPLEDAEALEALGERIAVLSAHLHATEYERLVLIAEFDRRRGWELGGHRGCADWLHFRTGLDRGAARERVRVARALPRLPRTSEAMARGELSFSKVRALSRLELDDPEKEEELVAYARQCTTAELEKLVRGWKDLERRDEADLERRRHRRRKLSVFPDEEGSYVIRGRLDPEVGALLMRAIEAASDALYRREVDWAPEGGAHGPRTEEVTPRQRRADAIGLLAERALAAGFGANASPVETTPGASSGESRREPLDEAAVAMAAEGKAAEAPSGPRGDENQEPNRTDGGSSVRGDGAGNTGRGPTLLSGTRVERYQVLLHVEANTLTEGRDHDRSHLEDGTRVSAETSRRLACDTSMVKVTRGADGEVLDVGRKTRTVPPALRRALEVRDGGCRFPGCGLRFTEAHHIRHWADGGETKLGNLVLLCRHHHRALHEEGFRVKMGKDGRPRFFDRTGWPLPDAPPPPPALPPRAVERLVEENRRRGADPDGWSCSARYERGRDVPWELEARALEALEAAAVARG